ncbi:MAG: MATE family efflux transporter [Proteobacteria bacterium]|nr:MATE family efflux transporter [Pseudomonadota bacterium]
MVKKYLKEFKHLLRIGVPIFGSQLSYVLMGTTDTIIAGRASSSDLAGLAVGNAFSMTIFMFISGVIFAVTPIVAQLYGAKKFKEIGIKLREILWIAGSLGIFLAILFMNMGVILDALPIEKSITDISEKYLKAVALGFAFITIFTCLRCYSEGMTLTKPVFFIAFFGMIINIPLDLIFVYGWFGAPKLGGVGCGIATSIVSFVMMVTIFIYINLNKKYKATQPFTEFTFPSKETTKEVFKLGTPIGFGIFIELSMFSGAAIILGILGENIVASHTIAINVASLFFMVPLSVGLASATRVGNLIGEGNYRQAKVASHSTIYMCILTALLNVVLIMSFRELIVGIYTTDEIVFNLAVYLLIFAAIFQLPDGIQMGALGSLRGYKDTFIPMILLFISYWIFAMPVGYYLTKTGFSSPLGAAGMWYGMIIGLSIFSILAVIRLHIIIKKYLKINSNQTELLQQ